MTPLPLFFLFFLSCLLQAALSDITPEQADGSGQAAIQDASQPFAGADETGSRGAVLGVRTHPPLRKKGNVSWLLAQAYYCTTPFWNAEASEDAACVYASFSTSSSSDSTSAEDKESKGEVVVIISDPCTSLRGTTASAQGKPHTTWYRNVACFAPDEGVVCTVYESATPAPGPPCASPTRGSQISTSWAGRSASLAMSVWRLRKTAMTTTTSRLLREVVGLLVRVERSSGAYVFMLPFVGFVVTVLLLML
ncbi:hypothetical protein IWX49DRAFT_141659 [Phyllosticta citricarpa]|uniref:Uncharacterized protein n=1 Tax=Phyllosticta paracitricarpa TaxID=2016321 RepID=A0ABR1N847_9PEZI